MVEDRFKRKPYIEKFVKDLSIQDFKVSVSGIIVTKSNNSFLLDDGTGQIQVIAANIPDFEYIRVFGKLLPTEAGFEIDSEIIQDLSKIDKTLYKKVKELLSQRQ
ncbi:MAG: hypothetical protein Q8R00_02675 [Candidatus Nanoarchaeia archaeon]|nr:hypothetical protein [Candidatus Nanoarchaeia archaeon]